MPRQPLQPAPQPRLTEDGLRWLVCPTCHSTLALEAQNVRCTGCARRFPITDSIPALLAERAF